MHRRLGDGTTAIADDADGADRRAGVVEQGADGEGDRHQVPELVAAHGDQIADRLSLPDAVEDLALVGEPLGQEHAADGLAEHLFRRVAVETLGAAVPGHHVPVEIAGDQGVVDHLGHGVEAPLQFGER